MMHCWRAGAWLRARAHAIAMPVSLIYVGQGRLIGLF